MSVASSRGARGLILVALAGVLAMAVLFVREAWADSGSFTVVLFGIPLVCAAAALWAESTSSTRLAPAVVALAGLVSLVWSLLTAGGIGIGFAPSSLLLLGAAMVSWSDRRGQDTARRPQQS
jgi:hypothetical protein